MITTKSSTDSALDPKQLGFEEAAVKGKIYNPLSGKELLEFLIRHIKGMLSAAEPPVVDDLAEEIAVYTRARLERHPGLDTEVQAYPKADVKIGIYIGPDMGSLLSPAPMKVAVNILVTKHPAEEKRGFGILVEMFSPTGSFTGWEDRKPLALTSTLNLDSVPPDALRILNDLPVPVPQRVPGSGPSGEATVVDQPKPATEKQKEAVQKQFGSAKVQEPLTSKTKKEGK